MGDKNPPHRDHSRLHQVLVNLLTNAVRYGQGEIHVLAHTTGTGVAVEVHDDGPGIAKKHEAIVWERFERGAHRLDSTIPGSGIGLSIARSLVTAHGGALAYSRSSRLRRSLLPPHTAYSEATGNAHHV